MSLVHDLYVLVGGQLDTVNSGLLHLSGFWWLNSGDFVCIAGTFTGAAVSMGHPKQRSLREGSEESRRPSKWTSLVFPQNARVLTLFLIFLFFIENRGKHLFTKLRTVIKCKGKFLWKYLNESTSSSAKCGGTHLQSWHSWGGGREIPGFEATLGLQNKFQDGQDYTEKLYLKNKMKQNQTETKSPSSSCAVWCGSL